MNRWTQTGFFWISVRCTLVWGIYNYLVFDHIWPPFLCTYFKFRHNDFFPEWISLLGVFEYFLQTLIPLKGLSKNRNKDWITETFARPLHNHTWLRSIYHSKCCTLTMNHQVLYWYSRVVKKFKVKTHTNAYYLVTEKISFCRGKKATHTAIWWR